MNCKEKHRLLDEYEAATRLLSQVVERYGAAIGTLGGKRDQVERIADEARRICRELQAALEGHRFLHGC